MIKIRLQRKGRIRRPIYHIVVADSRSPRDGRVIEQLGRYDGVTEKKELVINEDRVLYWLETGAQPTDTVRKILRNEGILYKRHLKMWGKSEEEIEAALTEWKSYKDSKSGAGKTRKEQAKAVLAAEEKAYKAQQEIIAAKAAEQKETAKKEAEAAKAAKIADATPVEVTETESVAEEISEATEETVESEPEVIEELGMWASEGGFGGETVESEPEVIEEPVAETTEETITEEPVAETREKVSDETEEANETPATIVEGQVSAELTAKEAIDHIQNSNLAELEGFVTEAETRKTVLSAWDNKKSEG